MQELFQIWISFGRSFERYFRLLDTDKNPDYSGRVIFIRVGESRRNSESVLYSRSQRQLSERKGGSYAFWGGENNQRFTQNGRHFPKRLSPHVDRRHHIPA